MLFLTKSYFLMNYNNKNKYDVDFFVGLSQIISKVLTTSKVDLPNRTTYNQLIIKNYS